MMQTEQTEDSACKSTQIVLKHKSEQIVGLDSNEERRIYSRISMAITANDTSRAMIGIEF